MENFFIMEVTRVTNREPEREKERERDRESPSWLEEVQAFSHVKFVCRFMCACIYVCGTVYTHICVYLPLCCIWVCVFKHVICEAAYRVMHFIFVFHFWCLGQDTGPPAH